MSCLSPVSVPSKARDARPGDKQLVRCNKCVGCLKDNQNEWIYRLECEDSVSKHSLFGTLTYSPAHVPLIYADTLEITDYKTYIKQKSIRDCEMTVNPKDFQDYWKRVRSALPGVKCKHYTCFEYGDQFDRPHGHFVLFYDDNYDPSYVESVLVNKWDKGYVEFEPVCFNRLSYVTKYVLKGDVEAPPSDISLPCGHLNSEGFGIQGFLIDEKDYKQRYDQLYKYCEQIGDFHLLPAERMEYVSLSNGVKIPTPRYFRRKFYPNQDYLTENVIESNEKRFKSDRKKENRIIQDLIIKGYEPTIARVSSAVSSTTDSQRIRRDLYAARMRRKGL